MRREFYHFVSSQVVMSTRSLGFSRQIYTSSELKNHRLEIHSIYLAPIV